MMLKAVLVSGLALAFAASVPVRRLDSVESSSDSSDEASSSDTGVCANYPLLGTAADPLKIAMEPAWGQYSVCTPASATTDTWLPAKATDAKPFGCEGAVQPLATDVCAAAGISCELVITKWANIWDGNKGAGWVEDFDVAAAARNTKIRQEAGMYYSNPYTKPAGDGLLMQAKVELKEGADIFPALGSDITMCATSGWALGEDYLNEMASKVGGVVDSETNPFERGYNIEVKTFPQNDDVVTAVEDGTCRYALFDGDLSEGLLETAYLVPKEEHLVGGISFMVDSCDAKHDCALSLLNKGLDGVRANGQLDSAMLAVEPTEKSATFTNDEKNDCPSGLVIADSEKGSSSASSDGETDSENTDDGKENSSSKSEEVTKAPTNPPM